MIRSREAMGGIPRMTLEGHQASSGRRSKRAPLSRHSRGRRVAASRLGSLLAWMADRLAALRAGARRSGRARTGAQWHRWHKANARRRRQLRAYKQAGGGRINPRLADLRREDVR